jgi:DNA-binding beta-propeller fold protein YncE
MCSDFKTTSSPTTLTSGGIISTIAGSGIQSIPEDGALAVMSRLSYPTSVIVDLKGNIFYLDAYDDSQEYVVTKINSNGITTNTGVSIAMGDNNSFKFLTIDNKLPEQTVYVCDRIAIYKLIPDGSRYILSTIYFPTSEMQELSSIAFDKKTNTFLASSLVNGGIYRITINDAVIPPTATTANFANIASTIDLQEKPITVDSAGNVYVASSRIQGAAFARRQVYSVTKYNSAGEFVWIVDCGFILIPSTPFFSLPPRVILSGITVGPDGSIYVSNTLFNIITRIDGETLDITTFAGGGPRPLFSGDGGPAVESNLHSPSGITFDLKSNLLICDTNNYRIRKVTPLVTTTIAGKTTYNPPWFAPVEYRELCNCKINAPVAADIGGGAIIYDGLGS